MYIWLCVDDSCDNKCEKVELEGDAHWKESRCGFPADSVKFTFSPGAQVKFCEVEVSGYDFDAF